MALPATDQRGKKAQKSPPGILCYICVQNRVCREEMEPVIQQGGRVFMGRENKPTLENRTWRGKNRL